MSDQHNMRVSDRDRENVVSTLRAALDDGRLKMEEYVERMGLAYEAVTYRDLADLHADLPAVRPVAPPAPEAPAAVPQRGALADLPVALKILWTIWLSAVSINVVVWVLVGITTGHMPYPWPLWVAGPSGAALGAVSVGVNQIRHSRRSAPPRRQIMPTDSGLNR